MNPAIVKAINLRSRYAQQDWRMRNDKKLCPLFCTTINFHQQCQLPLRRQCSLRLIKEVQSIRPKIVLCKRQEALPVGFLMILCRRVTNICILLFLCCNIVKTFCPQKISPFFFAIPSCDPDCRTQFRMGIMRRKYIIFCTAFRIESQTSILQLPD